MRFFGLRSIANRLQVLAPLIASAIWLFFFSQLEYREASIEQKRLNLTAGIIVFGVLGSLWILSDRSSRQEEQIEKLEDEIERLRKLSQV